MRDSILQNWLDKKLGNQSRLARALGITPGAITQWESVPVERVLDVARFTKIARSKLRPDIYRPSKRERESSSASP